MTYLRKSSFATAMVPFLLLICLWSVKRNPVTGNPEKAGTFISEVNTEFNPTALKPTVTLDSIVSRTHVEFIAAHFVSGKISFQGNYLFSSAVFFKPSAILPIFLSFRTLRI